MANGYYVRNRTIYVQGSVDGKFYRVSTRKKADDKLYLNYVKKNHRNVLLKLIDKKESQKRDISLEKFGLQVLELTSYKRDPQTQKDNVAKFLNHIVPHFSNFRLEDIKPTDIEHWQNKLLKTYSTSTVRKIKSIFKMILHKAVGNDIIPKNPADYTESIGLKVTKKEPYSIEEMRKLISGAKGWFKGFLYLAFTTGMRTGELLGLRWEDIDMDKNYIYIKRAIVRGKIKISSTTKNHNRIAVVPKVAIESLEPNDTPWLFPSSKTDEPYYCSAPIVKREFKPLCEKLGVEYKTLYATRHTYISLMRNNGVDLYFLQSIIGHSENSRITDKHYATFDINQQKVEVINNVFDTLQLHKNCTKVAQ